MWLKLKGPLLTGPRFKPRLDSFKANMHPSNEAILLAQIPSRPNFSLHFLSEWFSNCDQRLFFFVTTRVSDYIQTDGCVFATVEFGTPHMYVMNRGPPIFQARPSYKPIGCAGRIFGSQIDADRELDTSWNAVLKQWRES